MQTSMLQVAVKRRAAPAATRRTKPRKDGVITMKHVLHIEYCVM